MQTQVKAPNPPLQPAPAWGRLAKRLILLLLFGTTLVWGIQRSSQWLDRNPAPAGFARGLLHGALMPLALPSLLVGHDVSIYARNNTGRLYKLGYTVGVNSSGALFFGIAFWRLTRWHARVRNAECPPSP